VKPLDTGAFVPNPAAPPSASHRDFRAPTSFAVPLRDRGVSYGDPHVIVSRQNLPRKGAAHEVSGMRQPYAFGASDLYPLRGVAPGAPTAARAGGLTTAWAGGFTAGSGDPAL
jgi:hypothetical protein